MSFKAPKKAAFKQFVILDADGVVAALSAIDGGQIDEILTRSAEERGGEGGGEINLGPAKGRGKRNKSRRVEEEIRRARTRHATAAKLLETLHESEAIGIVEGALDQSTADQVEAGMVLEFRAELRLHPLHQADQMLRSFVDVAPKLGEKKAAAELKPLLGLWSALVGTDEADARVLIEPFTSEPQDPRLLLPVPRGDFEVELEDILGQVTVIAQVERVLSLNDHHPTLRMLRGAPQTQFERDALEEGLPDMIDGLSEVGIPVSSDDVFIGGPALILRPICVYR